MSSWGGERVRSFERLLRKAFVVFHVLLVLTCVYYQARGFSWLVAGSLPESASGEGAPRVAGETAVRPERGDLTLISRLFGTKVAMGAVEASEADCGQLGVSIITASADESWSLATMREPTEGALLRRRGQRVGGWEIADIGAGGVLLTRADRWCVAQLSRADATPATRDQRRRGRKVRRVLFERGPNGESRLERRELERLLERPEELLRGTGYRLDRARGGIRITELAESSAGLELGLLPGDVLREINGFDLTDPADMVSLYARLGQTRRLVLKLRRDGGQEELTLDLTD